MRGLFHHKKHDPVQHLHRYRRDGARRDLRHRAARVLAAFVDGENRLDHLRLAHQADNHFRDQRHGAFAAGEQAGEVVARQVGGFSAGFDHSAIGKDHLQPKHVIGGDAVSQGVRPAGVFGDVAADGAGALAGGIGCIEMAAALDGHGDMQVDHAGVYHGPLVFEVDLEDAVSFMRAKAIISPPSRGIAPPESPVPEPRPTKGTSNSRASLTRAATSAVLRGKATRSGACLSPPPSYS